MSAIPDGYTNESPDLPASVAPRASKIERRDYRFKVAKEQLMPSALMVAAVLALVAFADVVGSREGTMGQPWAYLVSVLALVTFAVGASRLSPNNVQWLYTATLILVIGSLQVSFALEPKLGLRSLIFIVATVLASLSISLRTLLFAFLGLQVLDLVFVRPVLAPEPLTYSQTISTGAAMTLILLLTLVRIRSGNRQADLAVAIEKMALQDPLTGLLNRRGLDRELTLLTETARRLVVPIVVTYLDLDYLKTINDVNGHDAGDEAIARLGKAIAVNQRANDLAARIGGDEFLIISHGSLDAHENLLRRVRENLAQTAGDLTWWDRGFTSGSASGLLANTSVDQLTAEADAALYAAKRARNP